MRWSEAVTLEFVKLYLKHECLWNPSHAGYKLKFQREKAYAEISSDFKASTNKSLTVPEVKLKIKNLRTTYVQQVHKILQKSSPDSIYEPSLVWFHEMDKCLRHIPTNRHSAPYNNSQETPEVDSSCQIWVDLELQSTMENANPDPLVPQTDDEYESERPERSSKKIKKERHSTPVPYKKIKKKKFKHRYPDQDIITDSISENMIREDEFDIYGKFIASQLRKMDIHKALKLQLEIHSLVNEARISDLSDDS